MEAIVPYLNFNGNAAEALAFYSKALNGSILFQQSFGDSPMDFDPAYKDKIMHATFKAGELTIMASDVNGKYTVSTGTNVSLSLNFNDIPGLEKTFKAMSEGGIISMPLQDTFWGARFGMLTDKFGFHWLFNHDIKKPD
jgi:PhnB protein